MEFSCNGGKPFTPSRTRSLLLDFAKLNIYEIRGITRDDINYGTPDDRRNIIYRLKDKGLLIPLKRRENRLEQYALANLYNDLSEAIKQGDDSKNEEIETFEKGILDVLAERFSGIEPGLHNVHLKTKLLDSDITKEIYGSLKEWQLNPKNKGRSKKFGLSPKRYFITTIYPKGDILIDISCSSQSFKLHNPIGLIEFFSTLGEIRRLLIINFQNASYEIPKTDEWWLTQFDIDSTISLSDLKSSSNSINVSSSLRNSVQIKMFGHLFYVYIKSMPYLGESLRGEERHFPEKKPINLGIKEILQSGTPLGKPKYSNGDENSPYELQKKHDQTFTSAEQLLKKAKHEAEEKAKHEAEEKAKHEAEEKAKHEAEEKAKHEAEEKETDIYDLIK